MAYSKSPRPYRRYSVMMHDGTLYVSVRAHNLAHAMKLAAARASRDKRSPKVWEVFEGTVRRATS